MRSLHFLVRRISQDRLIVLDWLHYCEAIFNFCRPRSMAQSRTAHNEYGPSRISTCVKSSYLKTRNSFVHSWDLLPAGAETRLVPQSAES